MQWREETACVVGCIWAGRLLWNAAALTPVCAALVARSRGHGAVAFAVKLHGAAFWTGLSEPGSGCFNESQCPCRNGTRGTIQTCGHINGTARFSIRFSAGKRRRLGPKQRQSRCMQLAKLAMQLLNSAGAEVVVGWILHYEV